MIKTNLITRNKQYLSVVGFPPFPAFEQAKKAKEKEKGKKTITGEQTDKTIAYDASVGMPTIDIPKPLIIGGIVILAFVIGGIAYRLIVKS